MKIGTNRHRTPSLKPKSRLYRKRILTTSRKMDQINPITKMLRLTRKMSRILTLLEMNPHKNLAKKGMLGHLRYNNSATICRRKGLRIKVKRAQMAKAKELNKTQSKTAEIRILYRSSKVKGLQKIRVRAWHLKIDKNTKDGTRISLRHLQVNFHCYNAVNLSQSGEIPGAKSTPHRT